jgi:acetolactate synthase-1/2/3 large subunit
MARTHRVVDHIVAYLAASGVEYIFGVDGANIEDVYDAAYFCDGITAVLAKHEFSAATMADGFSRSGAGLGVVAATSGGGCLNTVAGLGEALASRVPVLALIGQPPTTLDGRGAFQDTSGRNGALNGEALFSAVSVFCRRISAPEEIATALPQAIAAARRGGPAVLLLPKDIQQAALELRNSVNRATNGVAVRRQLGDPQVLARALRRADGPITIIAGEQVARDDARAELAQLRSVLRARVATVPDAKDVAGTPGLGSSSALGVSGVMGHPTVATAIAGSALCLVVGTQLSVTARAGLDDVLAEVPTYSIGSAVPFVACTHVHTEDLRGSLKLLTQELNGDGRPTGMRVPDVVSRTELQPPPHDGAGVRYREAMAVLDAALPDGVDIVADAGNIGASAIHYLPARRDGRFVVALGMGGMGYSFGAALGIAFGRNRRTVVIAGDGSFFMHGMEIHTAVQYGLPVTFLLFDNHAHAMCVTREQHFYNDVYSYNRFGPSRLGAGLAAMFPGLSAVDVDTIDDLPTALQAALDVDGPSVIAVECSADEIPPFAAFLGNAAVKKPVIAEESSPHVVASA